MIPFSLIVQIRRLLCAVAAFAIVTLAQAQTALRPPSVPLVACDPYFSIWSPADKLTDADTTHWTGKAHRLTSLVRIDGKTFRLMGAEPANLPALAQSKVEVLPTRTICSFAGAGVQLTLTFMTPALPEDVDILSRPVTYVTWSAQSTDSTKHNVSVYLDARSELAVNEGSQPVTFEKADASGISAWRVGSVAQPVLKHRGDDIRIDWGFLYVAMAKDKRGSSTANSAATTRESFASSGKLNAPAAASALQNNNRNDSVIAFAVNLGDVKSSSSCTIMLAYDDLFSIQYMKKNLRPYWRRNGWEAADLLKASAKEYASLLKRCVKFDDEFMADLKKAGGDNYAALGALAYRQCFAAGKFVADENGQPISFCKENHSNGCIGTSDVFYPMAPQFLLFGPSLAKSFLVPFMDYAASERWKFPFAPHDLGTYPQANGQVYGDGERGENNQMPVEESGNLLILMAAVSQMDGDTKFAERYWPQLEKWAAYLKEKGYDPENQLCTDDFAGHLAHNVNLSVKAICGIGSFAKMCEMRGDKAKADEYFTLARSFAQRLAKESAEGDHLRLAYDRPGSWSQKYNMVWDRILGLNLFPAEVAQTEMAFYKKIQNPYGLALDNRETYTKLDWITWTATLTQNREDFDALIAPIIKFLNETPDRSPMTDWYQTKSAKKVGFTARPVVGGVFLQMLYDKAVWKKYAGRDETKAAAWAPMPKAPKVTTVVPAADKQPATWNYTTTKPSGDWATTQFNDAAWKRGQSGFGTRNTPEVVIGTVWNSSDIWLRREIELSAKNLADVNLWLHHDEDAEVYINGVLALRTEGFTGQYDSFTLTAEGRAALKPGKNLIAIHCHQTGGGQYIDAGFVSIEASRKMSASNK